MLLAAGRLDLTCWCQRVIGISSLLSRTMLHMPNGCVLYPATPPRWLSYSNQSPHKTLQQATSQTMHMHQEAF